MLHEHLHYVKGGSELSPVDWLIQPGAARHALVAAERDWEVTRRAERLRFALEVVGIKGDGSATASRWFTDAGAARDAVLAVERERDWEVTRRAERLGQYAEGVALRVRGLVGNAEDYNGTIFGAIEDSRIRYALGDMNIRLATMRSTSPGTPRGNGALGTISAAMAALREVARRAGQHSAWDAAFQIERGCLAAFGLELAAQ